MPGAKSTTSPESTSKKSKRSAENNVKSSEKLLESNSSVEPDGRITKKNLKTKKTRDLLAKRPLTGGNSSLSSVEDVTVRKVLKKRVTEPAVQSRTSLGRAYGNNISKQNILKASPQQNILKASPQMRGAWHTSSKTQSREYGDYYSWQTGLSYLETHRISVINSKGVTYFIEEYIKKLQKCHIFERGHNVEPFASDRLKLLNKKYNGSNSKTDLVYESHESVDIHKNSNNKADKANTKNVSESALKTIELIRKFKNGQSIEADLQRSPRNDSGVVNNKSESRQRVTSSGSKTNRNRSPSLDSQEILPKSKGNFEQMYSVAANAKKTDHESRIQDEKTSNKSFDLLFGIGQDIINDLEFSEQKENQSEKSDSLHSQSSFFLKKKFLLPSENSVTLSGGKNWFVPSRETVGSKKTRKSFEMMNRKQSVGRRKSD